MSKKNKKNKKDKKAKKDQRKEKNLSAAPASANGGQMMHETEMTRSDFDGELRRIQTELARLQDWDSQRAGTS